MTIWLYLGIYLSYENQKYIPGIHQVIDFQGKGIYVIYTWYILSYSIFLKPGIYLVYTRGIPGTFELLRSVPQQNRDWDARAHRFRIARVV